ncbi:hypothetical protein C8A00DRAFT_28976 [Chaetomidium leptoderma]|uniref:Uncharacterized protein n=1 Tax=Chaetomidium leptoderma TaxID=669021 RepID=A0AAN7A1K0_9PEZI|nr:hypothetical protein C8A00DRAFT_28976 [Chaetomidium leptoderma]
MPPAPWLVIQQDQPAGPPAVVATSVAEAPVPNPPEKLEETIEGSKPGQGDRGAEPPAKSDPAPTTNGGAGMAAATEPKPASSADNPAEATEPTALPTAPAAVEFRETNGTPKPAAEAVSEAPAAAEAEPIKGAALEEPMELETEKPAETAPAVQPPPANGGEIKPPQDTGMKDAPTAAETAETDTKDGIAAPVGVGDSSTNNNSNKRKPEDAFGSDVDAKADAAGGGRGGKKAKTATATAAPVSVGAELGDVAAPAAKAEIESAGSTLRNGGRGKAPPAPAKKGGRPKKQQQPGKAAPAAGRTQRQTRSQGPVV